MRLYERCREIYAYFQDQARMLLDPVKFLLRHGKSMLRSCSLARSMSKRDLRMSSWALTVSSRAPNPVRRLRAFFENYEFPF